jgi:predicted PurR-regulated permease PerM
MAERGKTTMRSGDIAQGVIATAAGIALLFYLRGVLIPLVLAIVLAVLVHALVLFIGDRWRAPHWLAVFVAGLVVISSATAAILIIAQGAAHMVQQAPQLVGRIEQILQQAGHNLGLRKPLHVQTLTGSISVPEIAGNVAGSVGSLFSDIILMVTYFSFLLVGQSRGRQKLANLSASSQGARSLENAFKHIAKDIETYLWVQTVTGVVIAGVSALVMFAVGLHNSLFWTIVLFLLCYIPMIGVTVGSIVPALFALLQFPSWWQAAVIFGGIQIVAFLVGNFVYPRLQAETQNIDPVATLFALAFWGFLWGLTGAFLAVPLTLIVMMICANFQRTRWVAVLLSNDGKPAFPTSRQVPKRRSAAKRG